LLQADSVSYTYSQGWSFAPQTQRSSAPPTRLQLRSVSVSVPDGGLVGILGPNGSGKTTLLKLLGGLLRPTAGRVLVDGQDVAGWSRRALARRISVVPQETHLAFDYSVLDVVLMGRYPHLGAFELESSEDVAIARDAMTATHTLALADRPFDTLSGGEKQRAVIASALAQSAGTMLLDEPTAALDPGYQVEVASLLRALNRDRGVTMAVATHDLNLAAGLCRQLVLLRQGEVIAAGPTREVLTQDTIRALYDLEADVRYHDAAGHVTVVPLRRTGTGTQNVEHRTEN
jgi:iron complex transport system ATP-binding protein